MTVLFPEYRNLVGIFISWKALLLCIACASPGPGYDTSTQLLFSTASHDDSLLVRIIMYVSSRLVRWDALYFLRVAQRGYLFEQEWAWGLGWTTSISLVAKVLPLPDSVPSLLRQAIAGTIIAHLAHLVSVFILFALTMRIIPPQDPQRRKTAFLAATLHILSPAGIFLSAPYSESLFASLTFLGMLLYTQIYTRKCDAILEAAAILGAGLCWGITSSIRGNGILSGMILACRAVGLLSTKPSFADLYSLVITVAAGILVALGNVLPQWIAYREFCLDATMDQSPTWCSSLPPSIYAYVQEHYWNNGFLRYWTLSNAPLFVLALPVLCLMALTSLIALLQPDLLLPVVEKSNDPALSDSQKSSTSEVERVRFINCMRLFALPQAALAILALFNFHVQIINRLSSGYPIWYIVLAIVITSRNKRSGVDPPPITSGRLTLVCNKLFSYLCRHDMQHIIVSGMVLYALVQGGLYASFMPPA